MGWALLDDGFYSHPKVTDLILNPDVDGVRALGIWPFALSWAHRYTIERPADQQGVIPARQLQAWDRMMGGVIAAAEALAESGLWDRLPDGAYRIHDFRHWAQLDMREAKQRAGRASAAKRWGTPMFDVTEPKSVTRPVNGSVTNSGGSTPSNGASNRGGNTLPGCVSNPQDQDQDQYQVLTPSANAEIEFDKFWSVYPRRIGKQAAKRAWMKAARTVSMQTIITGAERYAKHRANQDPQYTVHPATWLNQGRWDDDLTSDREDTNRSQRPAMDEVKWR